MLDLDFHEYETTYQDADGDEHPTTVRAAVIGDEHVYITDSQTGNKVRRELRTIGGSRQVSAGDVYVETERPGEYDYLTAAAWSATGYSDGTEGSSDDELDFSEDSSDFNQSNSDLNTNADADADAGAGNSPKPVKKAAAKRTLPSGQGS